MYEIAVNRKLCRVKFVLNFKIRKIWLDFL